MSKFKQLLEDAEPNADDLKHNWRLSYNFLNKVENNIEPSEYAPSFEGIELVILALKKMAD